MTKRTKHDAEEYITPQEAARLVPYSSRTLNRLGESGHITMIRLPSGHRRFLKADVEALLQEHAS